MSNWGFAGLLLHEIQPIKFALRVCSSPLLYSIAKLFQEKPESIKKWDITSSFSFFYFENGPVRRKVQGQISFQSLHCPHTQPLSLRQTLSQWLCFYLELCTKRGRSDIVCHVLQFKFSFVVFFFLPAPHGADGIISTVTWFTCSK